MKYGATNMSKQYTTTSSDQKDFKKTRWNFLKRKIQFWKLKKKNSINQLNTFLDTAE